MKNSRSSKNRNRSCKWKLLLMKTKINTMLPKYC